MKTKRKIILSIAAALITVTAIFGLASCDLFSFGGGGGESSGDVVNNYNITVTNEAMGLRYAAAEVIDSAVTITTELINNVYSRKATVYGSGTIITSDGYILTNRHVVYTSGYNVQSIKVTTTNANFEEKTYNAEIVTFVGSFDLDMRLLKITDAGDKAFKPVSIAKSDTLKLGDSAFMLGNSASTGFTLSSATVAHPHSLEFKDSNLGFTEIVKINAAVNHGNSGGGLFNLKGDLVGLVTYRKEGSTSAASDLIQGIGYAIRTEDVLKIIKAHYGETIYGKIAIDTYDDVLGEKTEAA